MRQNITLFYALSLIVLFQLEVKAQENTLTSGGEAAGINGSVYYSIGQVSYKTISDSTFSCNEGLQQVFDIIEITKQQITNKQECSVMLFPNPTTHQIQLNILSDDIKEAHFQLFDSHGKLLKHGEILTLQSKIDLKNFPSSTYFIRILYGDQETKIYKIIKN